MKCPFCRRDDDRVLDTRPSEDETAIRRRRECQACGKRFTTYERVERTRLKVVKKDGARVPFDRDKIRTGLEKACWKRPVAAAQIEALVNEIENYLEANYESEVPSRELGELVMERLRQLDQVAYVRFASVYRQFEHAQDFVKAVNPMLEDRTRGAT